MAVDDRISPVSADLLPCPLCQSTNVGVGVCYVHGSTVKEGAVRCIDCGCRATRAAWQARRPGVAQTPDLRADILDAVDWLEHSAKIRNNHFQVPEIIAHNEMAAAQAERIRLAIFSRPASPDTSTVCTSTARLPLPVKHYTGMPGAMINGEAVYDWLMDDGSVEAMTASDVEKRIKSSVSSPDRPAS
jgi:hypothetical protein